MANSVPVEQVRSVTATLTELPWIQLSSQHSPIPHGAMGPHRNHQPILPVNCSLSSPFSGLPVPWGACLVAVSQMKILVCGL